MPFMSGMNKTSPAFLLTKQNYGETSLIVRCFTLEEGMQSFVIKGAKRKKKQNAALYYPLVELELTYRSNLNSGLWLCTQNELLQYHYPLYKEPAKTAILMFLTEVLAQCLREEANNPALYEFIQEEMALLSELKEQYGNFHLFFLLKLSSYLGFKPNLSQINSPYFDLLEGCFSHETTAYTLSIIESDLLRDLVLSSLGEASFNQQKRRFLLNVLLRYYQIHVHDFKEPLSLLVLKKVFS